MTKLIIPEAALGQHIAVLGKTGSGKTFTAKGIIEYLLERERHVGIVDPTDAWWGLRSSRDGKGAGFPILVLGGEHGDLPLPALGGAAVARLLVEQGVNLIASTKHLTVGERTRWFIDFAGTISRLNRAPLHLVIDEAHNFAPQGKVPDPETGKMLHAANTLASGGRGIGVRLVMITQRPQKLHKDTLTSADTLIAMRMLAPHDRAAVEEWIKGCGDMAQGKEVLNTLAGLKKGEGWAWYPEGGFLERLKFPMIKTFDSSATPEEGHVLAAPKRAAEIDLTEVNKALADAVREAEANDPKLLRKKIADLEKAARGRAALAEHRAPGKSSLAAEYKRGRAEGFEDGFLQGGKDGRSEGFADGARALGSKLEVELPKLVQAIAGSAPKARQARSIAPQAPARPTPTPSHRPVAPRPQPTAAAGDLSGPQQKILNALAWMESADLPAAIRTQLALMADQSPTSSGYVNNLSALRSRGLIDYPGPSKVVLTDSGRAIAQPGESPTTSEELQEQISQKLSGPQRAILRKLIDIHPANISRPELAEAAIQSPTSSGYVNNLSRLHALGLIDYPTKGAVSATDVLFLNPN